MKIKKLYWILVLLCSASAFSARAVMPVTTIALVDPTQPDFSQSPPVKKTNVVKKKKKSNRNPVSKLNLQQTLISNSRSFAVINGKRMTLGKKIRGAKLIKISHDSVELIYGGKRYTLNLTFPSGIKEVKR